LSDEREVYFEIVRVGPMLKCSAIDPETNTEVFVVGPLNAEAADLKTLALKKLDRRLAEAR
jgi:hypothetical protein